MTLTKSTRNGITLYRTKDIMNYSTPHGSPENFSMEHQKFETPMTKSKVSQSTHNSLKKGEERTLANVSEKEAKHNVNPNNAHKT